MSELIISNFFGKHAFLSNFYPAELFYIRTKKVYGDVEHAYQAMKATNESDHEKIRLAESASLAKRIGSQVPLIPFWDQIKVSIMEELVFQKFNQNPELAKRLLETGDSFLVEGNSWNDTFWGVCNGVGKNHLGRILMEVRGSLYAI